MRGDKARYDEEDPKHRIYVLRVAPSMEEVRLRCVHCAFDNITADDAVASMGKTSLIKLAVNQIAENSFLV